MDVEYQSLENQGLSGFELLEALKRFEVEHSEHFESKVDLANFYLMAGEYKIAYQYSLRAESVLDFAAKSDDGKEHICIMYGDRARLELIAGNFDKAMTYVEKAIKADKENKFSYQFLKGQIFYAQEDIDKALMIFDLEFFAHKDRAVSTDYEIYMKALVEKERYYEAKKILEEYFNIGKYYFSLGTFASTIYENSSEFEKSVLSPFLDFDYLESFSEEPKSVREKFISNIDVLDEKIKTKVYYDDCIEAMNLLRDYFSNNFGNDVVIDIENDFFVKSYINLIRKIKNNDFDLEDLKSYISLRKHFSLFPSYFWYGSLGMNIVNLKLKDKKIEEEEKEFLERIITIGSNNNYIPLAKAALGEKIGLTRENSQKLMTLTEVYNTLLTFKDKREHNILEPIFDLLSLPDNDYTMSALLLLKERHIDLGLDYTLIERRDSASGKLRERIDYLLS